MWKVRLTLADFCTSTCPSTPLYAKFNIQGHPNKEQHSPLHVRPPPPAPNLNKTQLHGSLARSLACVPGPAPAGTTSSTTPWPSGGGPPAPRRTWRSTFRTSRRRTWTPSSSTAWRQHPPPSQRARGGDMIWEGEIRGEASRASCFCCCPCPDIDSCSCSLCILVLAGWPNEGQRLLRQVSRVPSSLSC